MKKLLSWMLVATLIVGLPSLASARRVRRPKIEGEVTKVETKTITIKQGTRIETIFVPTGTPITDKKTGATIQLSDLVGKHVKIKESSPGVAKSIVVRKHKKKKDAA